MKSQVISNMVRLNCPEYEASVWLGRANMSARLLPPWVAMLDVGTPPSADMISAQVTTKVKSDSHSECVVTQEITPGAKTLQRWSRTQLENLLEYRAAIMRDDAQMMTQYGPVRHMRFVIAGGSGLIGRALTAFLRSQGHSVAWLVRKTPGKSEDKNPKDVEIRDGGEIYWAPEKGILDPQALRGTDVLINLAGESIALGEWTQQRREAIWRSRVSGTHTLVGTIEKMKHRPFVLLNASAVGFYGNRGSELLDESLTRGSGFLAEVCAAWENEAAAADELGVRTACLRFGAVLSPEGGLLAGILPWLQKGMAGKLGDGRQWMSWVSIDDAVGAIYHTVLTQVCKGPVNVASPGAVTNDKFTAALSRITGRSSFLSVPRWVLRLKYGIEFANETALASAHAVPEKLKASGYVFRHEEIDKALTHVMGMRLSG